MFKGKKYQESAKLIDRTKLYDANEAIGLVCQTSKAKFDETVEIHIRLGVDSRHADQQVRGAVVLPHGTGKTVRTLVFAKGEKAELARAAGADYVGDLDMVQKIQTENWFEFDVVIATPDMMGVIGRLGKILHCPIGKASFGVEKLEENFNTLMGAVIKARPAAAKGQYVKSCVIASTMGPGVKVNAAKLGG